MTTAIKQYALLGQFTCLAADCPDTCCRQWDMPVDRVRLERYRAEAPELLEAVDQERRVMKRDATDDCVKFEGGLCGIQGRYGSGFLGDACHFYPRFHRRLGEQVVMSAALSCPETARLALFSGAPFALTDQLAERVPVTIGDTKPASVPTEEALATIARWIDFAGNEALTPERIIAGLVHDTLEPAMADASDPQAIYYAFTLLLATAPESHRKRLAGICRVMEQALGCRMNWATRELEAIVLPKIALRWTEQTALAPLLRRWIQAQIALTSFPFAGGKLSVFEHGAVLALRFATVKLALLSHGEAALVPETAVRIVQTIARFHDHLGDADLSLQIYRDAKWMTPGRLRGLVGDVA